MKKIYILFGMVLTGLSAAAQNDFVGRYNGSKMEIAQELIILPNGRFVFAMSYGSVDKLIAGTWEVNGKSIHLQEHKKPDEVPFIVYGRRNDQSEKGKAFVFNDYSRNTSIAFSFADDYAINSFRLLHERDQHIFNHSNVLNVTSKVVNKFFLSQSLSDHRNYDDNSKPDSSIVYEFKPAPEWNEFILYYEPSVFEQPFSVDGVLKDDRLIFQDQMGRKTDFATKENLKDNFDIKKFDQYFENKELPDSIRKRDDAENPQTYYLVKSVAHFPALLQIPEGNAHFKQVEEEGNGSDVSVPEGEESRMDILMADPVGTSPVKVKRKSKSVTNKSQPVKKKKN